MSTKSKRRKALLTLPTTPYKAFQGIIARIRECPNAELGMHVLMWLHFANRPLELNELQHALAVEKDHTEFDADNIPPRKAVLNSCLGLVVVDDETKTVRFMHFTLEEYFRDNAQTEFPDGYSFIAEICLTYLNFGELREPCTDLGCLKKTTTKYAFLNYASLYWGTYVKQNCNDGLKNLVRMMVQHESGRPPCAIQALYNLEDHQEYSWGKKIAWKFSGIHTIAYFGLSEHMANFYEVDLKDDYDRTPLFWAAGKGHEGVVGLLIERDGVNINAKDNLKRTPLMWAAKYGREAVVRLLVERDGVNIDVKDDYGKTPLMWAAIYGHEAVVRLLIERDGVNIDAKNIQGSTPLILAAKNGHEAVVRLLIERDGMNIDVKDNYGKTPLISAAEHGQVAVVRLLIERDDVNIDAKNNYGKTPLMLATIYGHEAIVRLLIERDSVNIDAKDYEGRTPLILAAKHGREAIVQLLIERDGVNIDAKDNEGRTPLIWAAKNGYEAVVRLLIERDGVNIDAKDNEGRTPLMLAAEYGYVAVVRLLTERSQLI